MASPPVVVIIYRDDAVRASVRFLFEAEGWSVQEFRSAAEFLASLVPGCLVLDQNLAGMTGLDLVAEVRKQGLRIPAVVTAERSDVSLLAQAREAGAVLVDALMPEDLIEAVAAAISGGSRPPEGNAGPPCPPENT